MSIEKLQQTRQLLREQRRNLPKETQIKAACNVFQLLLTLDIYHHSQNIAYYLADEGELNPANIAEHASEKNKNLFLPVITNFKNKEMRFFPYSFGNPLQQDKFGILEPNPNHQNPIKTNQLHIIFLPLVGFDKRCNRIGRGAGFYDRALACIHHLENHKRPYLIGLAYEFQKLPEIHPAPWDIALDFIISDKKIYSKN